MLRIVTYSEIDCVEWSRLVQTSATGTWFQSPEAYGFYESLPELFRPFVIAVERVNELGNERVSELKGICVGYITVEQSTIKQFFTRRAIILGGPALANDCTDEEVYVLMTAVREHLKSQAIYIETRNFNDYSKWRAAFEKAGFGYKPHLNFHVDCGDEMAMWEKLSENRRRQLRRSDAEIKLIENKNKENTADAEKNSENNFEVIKNEEDIREWYEILRELYRTKVKTPLWPVEFFLEAYRQGVGKFLLVKHNGKVIGGTMITSDKMSAAEPLNDTAKLPNAACGTVYEWFECGMNAEYKEQYPSVMATWAGMKYAAEHGCARYDMMGAGEPDVPYGVRDFKSEFGGELVEHGRFLYVCKSWLYRLGTMGIKLLRNQLL